MGYFPNGSSFAFWQEENCSDCVNYRDNGTGSCGCAITDAHLLTETHDKLCRRKPAFKLLDMFVPDDGPDAFKCRMRLTREMIDDDMSADSSNARRRQEERYAEAMREQAA